MRRTIFITATDTDAGKTYLTAGLVRRLRKAGGAAVALKPVVAGRNRSGGYDDLTALLRAQGMHDPTAINRYRFAEARAPALADRAGELQPEHLLNWCRLRMDHPGITLIEGVGGLMVPLTRDFLVADWIRALAPDEVWLVVRARLGAINHMLLSIAQLAQMQMPPRHIILNAPDDEGRGYLADLHRALKMVACNAKVHTLLAGEMPVPQDFGLRVRGEND